MPYRSKKQEAYLRSNKPEVAKKFDKEMPKRPKKKRKRLKPVTY